jgi:acyl-CoA reductase-like NAD-dependent aldehyde dehydrogenase
MSLVQNSDGKQVVPIWVNGAALPLDSTKFIPVTSSASGKIVHYAQGASDQVAKQAADTAASAFRKWKVSNHVTRRELFLKVAAIYERRVEEIVRSEVLETSCTETYARFNVVLACRFLRESAGSITDALRGDIPALEAEGFGLVFKEAVGPVLIIPPWNSSIILSTRGVVAALAADCTVVLKSSELCPQTHLLMVEAFEEAGLPAGCLNSLQALREDAGVVTETLIAHPAIRKIEFIGSASVGSIIGQVAAKHLKPVLMELGGKVYRCT